MDNNLNQQELIGKCFSYWNSLKRHRALIEVKKSEGKRDEMVYHQMQTYKMGDLLELALRALQKGQRVIDTVEPGEENND